MLLNRESFEAPSPPAKIKDLMTWPVERVSPQATVKEVAERMKSLDLGAVPVCEGEKVLGVISDRDLTLRLAAEGRDPSRTTALEVMSEDVLFCAEEESVREAARIMEIKKVREVFVVNRENRLVGRVSLGDLARVDTEGLVTKVAQAIWPHRAPALKGP